MLGMPSPGSDRRGRVHRVSASSEWKEQLMRLPAVIGLIVLAMVCRVAPGQGLQSNHGVLRAVPVPRPVEVDGKLDEWDTSAEMFAYGVRRSRDRYSVRVSAMWDDNAL